MKLNFPKDFIFGVGISAFQTEMGVSKEAHFEGTDWYKWSTSPTIIKEKLVSGDDPAEGDGFWDLYKEDISNAKELGQNAFRTSIEWARIFPENTFSVPSEIKRNSRGEPIEVKLGNESYELMKEKCNMNAVKHYKEIFSYIRSKGMKVFLTIYHWPLPLWLHDPLACHTNLNGTTKTGWLNQTTIEEYGKYSDFVGRIFKDDVDVWETINEPDVIATEGYLFGKESGFPPGLSDLKLTFRVERNLAIAHNVAYKNLKRATHKEVGLAIAPAHYMVGDDRPETLNVLNRIRYIHNEWILNAVVLGKFDDDLDGIAEDNQSFNWAGTDYIGVDYYQRHLVHYDENANYLGSIKASFEKCKDCSDFGWDIYPPGITEVSKWIYEKYRKPIYIFENGIADSSDTKRERYTVEHLRSLSSGIMEQKIPIKGYFHWSLFDNFEWAMGYKMRFGLYEVDYKTKERRKRKSAESYERISKGLEL